MKTILMVLFGVAILVGDASACGRCGRFRGCSYCKYYVAAPVYRVQQPNILVVQNNNPAPIAAQGNSIYGYNAAVQAYAVNPAEVLHQASQLAIAAGQTAATGIAGFNSTAQLQLGLQARIAEPIVRGNAAAQVLTAAGLNQQALSQPQSLSLRIVQGPDGNWAVQKTETVVGSGQPQVRDDYHQQPQGQQLPAEQSILTQKCGKCHGRQLNAPKKDLYIDPTLTMACDRITQSLRMVRDGKMPPNSSLTPQEKGAIMEELLKLEATPLPSDDPPPVPTQNNGDPQ